MCEGCASVTGGRNRQHLNRQAITVQPERILHKFSIYSITLHKTVHNSLGLIRLVLLCGYKSPVSVFFRNGVGTAGNSHGATIGLGGDIPTSHTNEGPGNLKASGAFGFGDAVADGFDDLGHINDNATA
jgi:hypothetical protein